MANAAMTNFLRLLYVFGFLLCDCGNDESHRELECLLDLTQFVLLYGSLILLWGVGILFPPPPPPCSFSSPNIIQTVCNVRSCSLSWVSILLISISLHTNKSIAVCAKNSETL